MIHKEEKSQVVKGLVRDGNYWTTLEKKAQMEEERRQKIESGYVELHGEWISIEEKLRRLTPKPEKREGPQQVIINKNDYRQIHNVHHHHDHTYHETVNEHKHLHVHKDGLENYSKTTDGQLEDFKRTKIGKYGTETKKISNTSKKYLKSPDVRKGLPSPEEDP